MPFPIVLTGFLSGLALIVAIGAQNAYVLRLGLGARGRTIAAVVAVCALSDALLICLGVAGIGALTQAAPAALLVMRLAAIAFLLIYGALSLRRAFRNTESLRAEGLTPPRTWPAVVTVLAFTWLNPHVYLDTVLFLGSLADGFGAQRWWFAAGAILASIVWFTALGFGARLLRPVFAKAWTWRALDGAIAVIMFVLAAGLIAELLHPAA